MAYNIEVADFFRLSRKQNYPILYPTGTGSEVGERIVLAAPLGTTGALVTPEGRAAIRVAHQNQAQCRPDILTTATWTRRIAFREAAIFDDWERASREHFALGIQLAREAAENETISDGHRIYVGLSIGPLECSENPQALYPAAYLYETHYQTALIGAGVSDAVNQNGSADFNAFETFSTELEAVKAAEAGSAVYEKTGVPFSMSLKPNKMGKFPDGTIAETIEQIRGLPGLLALGGNCITPDEVSGVVDEIRANYDGVIIISANGDNNHIEESWYRNHSVEAAIAYAKNAEAWLATGALGIGGCCGTVADPYGLELAKMIGAVRCERRGSKRLFLSYVAV